MTSFSRYIHDIAKFAIETEAKAAYCFVLDGNRGTGGCPIVMGVTDPLVYRERCEQLLALMKRSVEMFERDLGMASFDETTEG